MLVKCLYFASSREVVGVGSEEFDVEEGINSETFKINHLFVRHPELKDLFKVTSFFHFFLPFLSLQLDLYSVFFFIFIYIFIFSFLISFLLLISLFFCRTASLLSTVNTLTLQTQSLSKKEAKLLLSPLLVEVKYGSRRQSDCGSHF